MSDNWQTVPPQQQSAQGQQPRQYAPAPQPVQYAPAPQPVQYVQQPVYLAESTPRHVSTYPTVYIQAINPVMMNDSSDTTAFWLMIIGFFIPILALINICMHFRCSNLKARKYANISFGLLLLQIGIVCVLYYSYNHGNYYSNYSYYNTCEELRTGYNKLYGYYNYYQYIC